MTLTTKMAASYTLRSYLNKRLDEGTPIMRTEKFLQDDLNKYVGGRVLRSDIQILRRGLVRAHGVRKLLADKGHAAILSKVRICQSEKLHSQLDGKAELIQAEKPLEDVRKEYPTFVRKKSFHNLSRQGKFYRAKKLAKVLHENEIKLLKGKSSKANAFQSLCFQKDANMSERDIQKTQKLVKGQLGNNVLAGRHLRKKAVDEAIPDGILADDFSARVTLQAGLNKSVKRLLASKHVPIEMKERLKSEKECTFYCKAGQDGTTGDMSYDDDDDDDDDNLVFEKELFTPPSVTL